MNHRDLPGGNLLVTVIGWMVLLPVLAITVQILVLELTRWVRALAPWLLLTVLIGAGVVVLTAVLRRRRYGY